MSMFNSHGKHFQFAEFIQTSHEASEGNGGNGEERTRKITTSQHECEVYDVIHSAAHLTECEPKVTGVRLRFFFSSHGTARAGGAESPLVFHLCRSVQSTQSGFGGRFNGHSIVVGSFITDQFDLDRMKC